MFLRLLLESFRRQRRRKALAGIAILLGTTAVTAMLALATTIGDRIHRELAVYGANIVVYPKADSLDVKVGGVDLKPATGGAYLHEKDIEKLHGIFWANNITEVSPELRRSGLIGLTHDDRQEWFGEIPFVGLWFNHPSGPKNTYLTGAPQLHPSWTLKGKWPSEINEAVVGAKVAAKFHISVGQPIQAFPAFPDWRNSFLTGASLQITGIVNTGDSYDNAVLLQLEAAHSLYVPRDAISRIEISAKTRPEDAFARLDPDKMSPKTRDIWYCRPYANSIAFQIQEAIPGSVAQQVRKVEQTEGTVLERISGLMWLISAAALLAAGFAVSAAMATAVLERRGEIGLMRSLGAGKAAIAALFYAESGLLALLAGTAGYFAGSALAWALGRHIFAADGATPMLNLVLLPVVVATALLVAIAGSTPSIRAALRADPSATLRGDA